MVPTDLKGSAVAGATNPDETGPPTRAVLYALSSMKYGINGVLVNGYGPSADPIIAGIAQRLHKVLIMRELQSASQEGAI